MDSLTNDWFDLLRKEFEKDYYKNLMKILKVEYDEKTIYPSKTEIFSSLNLTPFENTKVVIIGQDPYHGENQAHGLSFSVKPGVKIPPSLRNIYKELHEDIGCSTPNHGSLTKWAKEGVLLLNTVLTVRAGTPNSHKDIGWEHFTNRVIETLNERALPVVFILWGKHAQEKIKFINTTKHYIIQSPHPSPFSARRGFFNSRPFSRANMYLKDHGIEPIDWQIPSL
jgi:uracil-DNA glycosylase